MVGHTFFITHYTPIASYWDAGSYVDVSMDVLRSAMYD